MKAIKPLLVLNMPAPATLDNRFAFSSTTMAQLMNPPPSLIYNKYFTQQLLFQLVTVNPIQLLPTSVSSELNVNEVKNLNCICRDLVHYGHGSLVLVLSGVIICLCWIIILKKLWIVKMLLVNCDNYESSWGYVHTLPDSETERRRKCTR